MTLGTGIFYSTLIASVVVLYIFTRDRWSWVRIGKWAVLVLVVMPASFYGALVLYNDYQDRPKKMDELWELQLGHSKADVLFLKGEPDEKEEGTLETWVYREDYGPTYAITFTNGFDEITRIAVIGGSRYNRVNRIAFGDPYSRVIERLGEPGAENTLGDGTSRSLDYYDYNMRVGLSKGKVEYLAVTDFSLAIELAAPALRTPEVQRQAEE